MSLSLLFRYRISGSPAGNPAGTAGFYGYYRDERSGIPIRIGIFTPGAGPGLVGLAVPVLFSTGREGLHPLARILFPDFGGGRHFSYRLLRSVNCDKHPSGQSKAGGYGNKKRF